MALESCLEVEPVGVASERTKPQAREVAGEPVLESAKLNPLPLSARISPKTKFRLKLLFSLLMFASLFVFGKVDLSKSWEVAVGANPWYLSAAAVLFFGSTVINAMRWQILASAVGLTKPLVKMVQFCYVGTFFNLFLPSTVGGDFSRGYYLSKGTGHYKNAFYSVLADRTVGIAVLFLFATVGMLAGPAEKLPMQLKIPILLGTVGIFGVIPFMPQLCRVILGEHNWITRRFNNSAVKIYWSDRKVIFLAILLSIVLQTVLVLCHVAVGFALGLTQIPLWYYFVFYPTVAVLGFITPSVNGIGIREWAYTYFLTRAGVDNSHALTYAIMWLALNTMNSLVGGLVYVAGHFQISKEEAEQAQHEEL